jgi:hypothetical protein
LTFDRLKPAQTGRKRQEKGHSAAKAAAFLPPVKLMQRGGSLEDELCPNEIEGWTLQNASPELFSY